MRSGDRGPGVLSRLRNASLAPWKLLLPVAAVLGAGAAVAIGDIPGSSGTIIGCANTVGTNPVGFGGQAVPFGQLRVLDPSDTTDPNADACIPEAEETVTWNQQGPAGPPGPSGQSGVNGASGANGADGSNGKDGANGASSVLDETNFSIESSDSDRLYLKLDGVNGTLELKGSPASWSQVTNTSTSTGGPLASTTARPRGKQDPKQTIAGLIPLGSFAAGDEANTIGSQTSGAGAGKVVQQTFVLTKASDKADAILNRDLFNHTVLKSLELIVTHGSGDTQVQAADYTLTNVEITNVVDTGKPGKKAVEVIGAFTKMTGDLGTGTNTVPMSWNRVTNQSDVGGPTPLASP
jgi:type VI protein secretion system component Hcp